jgi:diaminopropionate ammonia-lyase
VIFMPGGSSPVRLQRIRQHGADASVIAGNYDDAVELAVDQAQRNDWLLLQDTAREGYEKIPAWIMQGYAGMIDEVFTQQRDYKPTHVLVQCGVGSFAASIQAYLTQKFGDARPFFIVVEPTRAGCYFASMTSEAKLPVKIFGEMDTIMAGLACGEPSSLAWGILKDFTDVFVVCPDEIAMQGMRILGTPLQGDDIVVSGESGAVTLGLLNEMLITPQCKGLRKVLGLDGASDILLFSTEGDTDPAMYRKIVQQPRVNA